MSDLYDTNDSSDLESSTSDSTLCDTESIEEAREIIANTDFNNIDDLSIDENKDTNNLTDNFDYNESDEQIREEFIDSLKARGLDDKTIDQIMLDAQDQNWRTHEVIDSLTHPDYETQKSYMRDDEGELQEVTYGRKGSQRPDLIEFTEEGIDIREDKDYPNEKSLARNIEQQAADRHELFGDDLNDLTFVISPKGLNYTLEEADHLSETATKAGANIEYRYK